VVVGDIVDHRRGVGVGNHRDDLVACPNIFAHLQPGAEGLGDDAVAKAAKLGGRPGHQPVQRPDPFAVTTSPGAGASDPAL
jgi:hypothetical protein